MVTVWQCLRTVFSLARHGETKMLRFKTCAPPMSQPLTLVATRLLDVYKVSGTQGMMMLTVVLTSLCSALLEGFFFLPVTPQHFCHSDAAKFTKLFHPL